MKKSIFALAILALVAADANASIWSGLTARQRTSLVSGRTLSGESYDKTRIEYVRSRLGGRWHANEGHTGVDADGEHTFTDDHEPLFNVVTTYRLINATPAAVAAVFSNYTSFPTIFTTDVIPSCSIVSGALPRLRVLYGKTTTFGPISRTSVYQLQNVWRLSSDTTGPVDARVTTESIVNTWEYLPGHSSDNGDAFHIDGGATLEAVTTAADGTTPLEGTKTLVKYVNYILPASYRAFLNNPLALSQNRDEVIAMLNALGAYTEGHDVRAITATFCTAMSGTAALGCN